MANRKHCGEPLTETFILKVRVHGSAHARESRCCFFAWARCTSTQAILFHDIVKELKEASRLLGCEILLPKFRV